MHLLLKRANFTILRSKSFFGEALRAEIVHARKKQAGFEFDDFHFRDKEAHFSEKKDFHANLPLNTRIDQLSKSYRLVSFKEPIACFANCLRSTKNNNSVSSQKKEHELTGRKILRTETSQLNQQRAYTVDSRENLLTSETAEALSPSSDESRINESTLFVDEKETESVQIEMEQYSQKINRSDENEVEAREALTQDSVEENAKVQTFFVNENEPESAPIETDQSSQEINVGDENEAQEASTQDSVEENANVQTLLVDEKEAESVPIETDISSQKINQSDEDEVAAPEELTQDSTVDENSNVESDEQPPTSETSDELISDQTNIASEVIANHDQDQIDVYELVDKTKVLRDRLALTSKYLANAAEIPYSTIIALINEPQPWQFLSESKKIYYRCLKKWHDENESKSSPLPSEIKRKLHGEKLEEIRGDEVLLNTAEVVAETAAFLQQHDIPVNLFTKSCLRISKDFFNQLMNEPKEWTDLHERDKQLYWRMHKWAKADSGKVLDLESKLKTQKKSKSVVIPEDSPYF